MTTHYDVKHVEIPFMLIGNSTSSGLVRSAAMWRSSWLSREVIALPLFMLGLTLYGLAQYMGWRTTPLFGAVAALLCLALFVCTAMVYMSIRFLQEWASPLTLANYLLLGCASGFMLATLLATLFESSWPLVQPLGWAERPIARRQGE